MSLVRCLVLLVVCTALVSQAAAGRPPTTTGFLFKSMVKAGETYRYTIYVPREYDGRKAYPLIMFLHGSGESGTDGWTPVMQGIGTAIMAAPEKWPFIVLFPQKPAVGDEWEQLDDVLMDMLKAAKHDYRIDGSRMYLTGLSMGGHGAWTLAARHPNLWAAIAPIAGYADATDPTLDRRKLAIPYFTGKPADIAASVVRIPVWAFHGGADDDVPLKDDEETIAAIKSLGGDAKLTVYPAVGHNAWDKAYRTENLGEWFLQHTKPAR